MEVLDIKQTHYVQGGNSIAVPLIASVSIGATTGLLYWAVRASYNDQMEEFSSPSNYFIEGTVGAAIATLSTLGFVLAA